MTTAVLPSIAKYTHMTTHTNHTHPFVSIVVCTYNRSAFLGPCLESLARQSYPTDRYEVIVVDDASTDATPELLARFPQIRLVRHPHNRGIPTARNSGMNAAHGDIVAYIDDDTVADPEWLAQLIAPYADTSVTAVGGITYAYKGEYIAERYLAANGYGNPAPLAFGASKNPLWRLFVYLKSMFFPIGVATEQTDVQAIYTLNASYRADALRAIGGFDETLLSEEDTDVSIRLRRANARIVFTPDAIIRHRHRESVVALVRQAYHRAENTLRYYEKEGKSLPIFPMPTLYLLGILALLVLRPIVVPAWILVAPVFLYGWWALRAVRERQPEYLAYGYIQLALELASLAGLARATIRKRMHTT